MQVEGKTALITGSGTGVGRATALKLAALGCHIVVNYSRSQQAAEQTIGEIQTAGGRALALKCDVADDAQVAAMVATAMGEFGRLDVLVNNAGTTEFIPFPQLDRVTDDTWRRILGVNLLGPFHCARAAAKAMQKTASPDGAEIVNVTSVAGIAATGSSIPYGCSKAALNHLTVQLARTLAPRVRVNAVAPGFIAGTWLEKGLGDNYERTKRAFEKMMPLGKVSTPEDVADAIVSLITGSDLVTGRVLVCDGGMLIKEPVAM